MSIEIGDGGLGYIYLGDVLIAGGGGGGEITQTFDFQNDGALRGNTWIDAKGTYGYETGQGYYQYASGGTRGAEIKMPSAISGTLKKIEIRGYKPNDAVHAFGINASNSDYNNFIRCGAQNSNVIQYCNGGTESTTGSIGTGEAHFVIELGDDGTVTWTFNTQTGTFSASTLVTKMREGFNNGTLCIMFSTWNSSTKQYVRKIQFTAK